MRPLGNLLIGFLAQVNLILNVTDITHRDLVNFVRGTKLHHMSAGFVQDVTLLAAALRTRTGAVLQQSAVTL